MRNTSSLPDRAKFRAINAIRALQWASKIHDVRLPIPACYCALHASEEAVAAFVSTAKESGYGEDAKINIRDHKAKASVVLVAQKIMEIIQPAEIGFAYSEAHDQIMLRFGTGEAAQYRHASTKVLAFGEENNPAADFYTGIIRTFDNIGALKEEIRKAQKTRNDIFYATDRSYPTGFLDPDDALLREFKVTLGLLWAAIDVFTNKGIKIPLICQSLRTANLIIAEMSNEKKPNFETDPE